MILGYETGEQKPGYREKTMNGRKQQTRGARRLPLLLLLLALLVSMLCLSGCVSSPGGGDASTASSSASSAGSSGSGETDEGGGAVLDEDGWYTSKEDVALYIHTYGELPDNFITKKEARALGWEGGSLEPFAPGKSIGGDRFGNREGSLPEASGRKYTECDIDTAGKKSRGAKRIVFSNDGLIFYTGDHYESFEQLY